MIAIGIILILLAILAGVLLFMGTASLTDTVTIDMPIGTLQLPPLALLITGAVVISVFWLGWVLFRTGIRRSGRRRKEAKEATRAEEARRVEAEQRAQEEYAARERELADERARADAEADRLRHEADERVAEQHLATETARKRAEVAEHQLAQTQGIPTDRPGEARPGGARPGDHVGLDDGRPGIDPPGGRR